MSIQKKSRIYFPVNTSRVLPAPDRAQVASARDAEVKASDGGLRIGRF